MRSPRNRKPRKFWLDRFWANVRKGEGCWEWTAGVNSSGYGSLKVNGKAERVHRASYRIAHGDIPAGLWVLHHCDNRRCVRPDHLYLGTHQDNMADMVRRRRHRNPSPGSQGEGNGQSKLTEDAVREIRRSTATTYEDAALYGVSQMQISRIRRGVKWKHVT